MTADTYKPEGIPSPVRLILVALLGIAAAWALAACQLQIGDGNAAGGSIGPSTVVLPPAATPSPSPSPSASPADPCKPPVTGINLSGPTSVPVGEVFRLNVTPVSASGPLEGVLDYCNNGRVPFVESMSSNLRRAGTGSSYGPEFAALGVGPFEIRIRVDGVSETFSGTVTR